MFGAAPHQVQEVTLAPAVANQTQLTPSAERYSLKPSSLLALSAQARSMRLLLTAVAARLLGAAGGATVVTVAVLE